MNAFFVLLGSHFRRFFASKTELVVYFLLLILLVQGAIFVFAPMTVKYRVALIGFDETIAAAIAQEPGLTATRLSEVPPDSEMARGRFDAIAVRSGAKGQVEISALRGQAVESQVRAMIAATNPDTAGPGSGGRGQAADAPHPERNPSASILGISIMFLLILGASASRVMIEDKGNGILRRVAATRVGNGTYYASVWFMVFLLSAIPLYAIVICDTLIFRVDVGMDVARWLLVLSAAGAFCASFACFFSAMMDDADSAMSASAMLGVLTTLLSGSFIAASFQSPALRFVGTVLPQRNLIDFLGLVTGSGSVGAGLRGLALLSAWILLFGLGGRVFLGRKR